MGFNMTIDTYPQQQQEAVSPQVVVVRSSSRNMADVVLHG